MLNEKTTCTSFIQCKHCQYLNLQLGKTYLSFQKGKPANGKRPQKQRFLFYAKSSSKIGHCIHSSYRQTCLGAFVFLSFANLQKKSYHVSSMVPFTPLRFDGVRFELSPKSPAFQPDCIWRCILYLFYGIATVKTNAFEKRSSTEKNKKHLICKMQKCKLIRTSVHFQKWEIVEDLKERVEWRFKVKLKHQVPEAVYQLYDAYSSQRLRDQVLSIVPETLSQAEYIRNVCNELQLDLWKPSMVEEIVPGQEIHVHVPYSLLRSLKENLQQRKISFLVMIDDVQNIIAKSTLKKRRNQEISLSSFDYTKYHPMDEIYKWMDQIKETHKQLVTLNYLGSTYENRPIYYFKVGLPSNTKKKIIWMDCGIHAREWIAVAFCQWFIKEILEEHNRNDVIHKALENIDFYIVPVLNIDGFVYSWTTDRLWRKTRSPHNNGTCFGVDLNRNFDARWCSIGASKDCKDITFCGTGPVSEPEALAVSQLVSSLKSDILCFLTIHSYGQLILLPYGYTKNASVNHEEMMSVGNKTAAKIAGIHGTKYRVGSASHILYSNSGSSRDWATDLGIPFSYTFELRDNGTFGFVLPEDQIKPTCEETTAAILTIIEYLNEKHFNSATSIFADTLWINLTFSLIIGTYYSLF
ncbi:carboxypeptidase O-like [Gastrophryne carolinensis]